METTLYFVSTQFAGKIMAFSMSKKLNMRAFVAISMMLAVLSSPLSALGLERNYSPSQDGHELDQSYYKKKDTKVRGEVGPDGGLVLKGEVNYCVPKGTPLKVKLATVRPADSGTTLRGMEKDLEGEYRPAKLGQVITAKVTEDIFVDTNKVIPEGTTLYGFVSKINPPRRMYRPGWLEIKFQHLKLPDGRKFAFKVEADNFKPSTKKTKLKGAGRLLSYAAGGAIVGAIVAYQFTGGWQGTAAMDGYNIAAGAGAGAIAATTYAAMKKGKPAVLEPGDDLNMNIDCDLLMPVATKPTKRTPKHLAGLDIQVLSAKQRSDGLGGKCMRVDLQIDNGTKRRLRSIDFYLEDTNGNRQPISVAQNDEDSQLMFDIHPYSLEKKRIHFGMEYPKLKHKIVILDHASRKVVHEVAL